MCGTTVRAVVTRELVTVQQEHTEYVKVCSNEIENQVPNVISFSQQIPLLESSILFPKQQIM